MRDFSSDGRREMPWAALQGQAEAAALHLGLGFAEAGRFGAAVARHIAAGREIAPVITLLGQPERIAALSRELDEAVETAFVSGRAFPLGDASQSLRASYFEGLPCAVGILDRPEGAIVMISPKEPSTFTRQDSVLVPEALFAAMQAVMKTSGHVPVQGARLMQL